MQVVLQRDFYGPGGVLYVKGVDGEATTIPNSLRNKLPKSARVLVPGERVAPPKPLPIDTRPKPGSGDPNADVEGLDAPEPVNEAHALDGERTNAEAAAGLLAAAEARAAKNKK